MPNTMQQYEAARTAMIDSQIHPMGVVMESLLEAFAIVPREAFVPEGKKGICYCDEDIEIGQGRYLMEPSVLGRIIQAAKPQKNHVAMTIGSGAGYSAAVLSHLVSTVVALESDAGMLKQSQAAWDAFGYTNIASVASDITNGEAAYAPYDLIIFNGAVPSVPDVIKNQLSDDGRLVAITKAPNSSVAKAVLIERIDEESFSDRVLFDAGTPYLKEFTPKKEFVF